MINLRLVITIYHIVERAWPELERRWNISRAYKRGKLSESCPSHSILLTIY